MTDGDQVTETASTSAGSSETPTASLQSDRRPAARANGSGRAPDSAPRSGVVDPLERSNQFDALSLQDLLEAVRKRP